MTPSLSWKAESVSMGKSKREHVGIFLWSGKRCQSQSCESIYKVFFYWSSHQNFYSWTWSHPIRQKIQKVETSEWKSQSQFKDGVGRAKIQSGQVFSNHLIQECCQSSNHSGVPTCFFSLSPTNLMIIIIFQKHLKCFLFQKWKQIQRPTWLLAHSQKFLEVSQGKPSIINNICLLSFSELCMLCLFCYFQA